MLDGSNYLRETNAEGSTLPDSVLLFRIKCLRAFLQASIAINKIDLLRDVLEEYGEKLTGRQHLGDLIPMVRDQERRDLKKMLCGRPLSLIFDGTTKLGEAMAILVRFVEDDFTICQKLIRLQLVAKSMSGDEIAHTLLSTLAVTYQVGSEQILASMRDRAKVNDVAVRSMKPLYTKLFDVGCFSHTLDHVGEAVVSEQLDIFVSSWVQLFSHSPKSRLEWKALTDVGVRSYSKTRWWSRFEVMDQLHNLFGYVVAFLCTDVESPGALCIRLRATVENLEARAQLQIQLAVVVEFSRPFVQATYKLEGDGPLSLSAYEAISGLRHFVNANPIHLPSTEAVARQLAGGNAQHLQMWITIARACLPRAVEYFNARFGPGGVLSDVVSAFREARLCDPSKVNEIQPAVEDVHGLTAFPFISPEDVAQLQEELPQYLAACEDIHEDIDALAWWKRHHRNHPAWSNAFKKILLVQPSSGAAERVFSLLQNSFSKQQESALEDYYESSIMLQYNHRK